MSVLRLLRNGLRFWRAYGTRGLLSELQRRLSTPVPPGMASALAALPSPAPASTRHQPPQSAQALLQARFSMLSPLQVFPSPREQQPRISLVTDSINGSSFFGGVATAMIIALLLAKRRGARLRIITRTEPPSGAHLHKLLVLHGLDLDTDIEFAFAHVNAPQPSINLQPDELLLTTSWWTTASVLAVVPPARVLYLLQEDERCFYPAGEDALRCQRTLEQPQLQLLVNTQGLLDHLAAELGAGLAARALAFEPAFPAAIFHPRPRAAGAKRRLMFYARPGHLRNLFYFGLELLDRAVAEGVLDTTQWELHFVGAGIPPLTLADGTVPQRHEYLGWSEYAELVGSMDLGLSLMITPHPSYPPLDLAASGAVVLSNRWGNKTDLSARCANILLADLTLPAMLQGLRQAVALACDDATRARQHAAHRLATDWRATLEPALQRFGTRSDAWA